jgi:hypothetical protein
MARTSVPSRPDPSRVDQPFAALLKCLRSFELASRISSSRSEVLPKGTLDAVPQLLTSGTSGITETCSRLPQSSLQRERERERERDGSGRERICVEVWQRLRLFENL